MQPTTTQAPVTPPNPYQVANPLPKATVNFNPSALPATPTVDFGQFADNPTGAATAFQGAQNRLSANQQTARNDMYSQYQQAIQGFGSTADNYGQLANSYGIPAYQQVMTGLQSAISGLRDNVTARTQGYNVNEAQAQKAYNQELIPLSQNLTDVSREYNIATGNIAELMKYHSLDQQMALKPLESYLQSLDSNFANQNQVFGNTANMGMDSIQSSMSNKLERDRMDQAANQFAQTFGLEQLKNTQQVEQFAQSHGLEVDKFKQSIAQFDKSYGLDQDRFKQETEEFRKQFDESQFWAARNNEQTLRDYGLAQDQFNFQKQQANKAASGQSDITKYLQDLLKKGQPNSSVSSFAQGAGASALNSIKPSLDSLYSSSSNQLNLNQPGLSTYKGIPGLTF